MFHPDDETLVVVALGDDAGLTEGQLEHLRSCAACSATVDSVVRTAALTRAASGAGPLVAPPPHVWEQVEAAVTAWDAMPNATSQDTTGAASAVRSGATVQPLPTRPRNRPIPAPAAVVPDTPPETHRNRPGRPSLGWGVGLAAAGLAIGLLGGRGLWPDNAPATTTIATAELDTLDTQQHLGDAALLRTAQGVDLRVTTSPLDPGSGYLEVWLINTDGKRMVSVGVLEGSAPETFPVSQALIDEGYVVVDISREAFDDRPAHSGDSLARGTLPT